MNDDAMRRILQLERRVQDLTESLTAIRNKRTNLAVPGSRLAILQPVALIAGRTESSGTFSITHGDARIYDLIVRDTSDPYQMKKVTGDSVDRIVTLANISGTALPANEFIFALSFNGIYVNALGGGGSEVMHFVSPSGGIPARISLTMGSASCDVYDCNTSGVLSDSGDNETVYNMSSNEFAGSTHGVAAKNAAGLWVAIVEDCGLDYVEESGPEPDPEPL